MSRIPGFDCIDCDIDTLEIDEYYMVHDHLWKLATGDSEGMLCFDCLSSRLGRALTEEDFTGCSLNYDSDGFRFATNTPTAY
jgi:hypothetical protein